MKFKRGDIIVMNFDPTLGHEQTGRRPALVLSNATAAQLTNMVMVCPITNTDNNHPLHVKLDERTKATGVILCEHIRSIDIGERNAVLVDKAPDDIVEECVDIVYGMID